MLCDVQERFRNLILNMPSVIRMSKHLVSASQILSIPLVATEQYPKALGHIVPEIEIDKLNPPAALFPKKLFSMLTPEIKDVLATHPDRKDVVLFGIEVRLVSVSFGVFTVVFCP